MMSEGVDTTSLQGTLAELASFGVVPGVVTPMRDSQDSINEALYAAVTREVTAFTESRNPDVLPELRQHLDDQSAAVCRLAADGRLDDFEFVREHARRRAEQKFPLDALLHAYRCAHRVFARWVRDAALETADDAAHVRRVVSSASDFTAEYIGVISTLLTAEYVSQTRMLAEAEGDRRTELLNTVLSGYDESDRRAARLLRRAGYLEQRQSFCVAVARAVDPHEMENEARAQRMAESLRQALQDTPVRSLIGVTDNLVTVVMSVSRRQSGWTAPQSLLAERVYPYLRTVGPAALIGLSSDAPSTSHIPHALSEAKLALDFASVANRVMPYSEIPFRHLVVSVARGNIQSELPGWVEALLSADRKSRGALLATLRAYADADMNVLRTAKALAIHPNTIYARMQKINDITNRNALGYHALTELLLAAECASNDRLQLDIA